jgi:hypothetical protein
MCQNDGGTFSYSHFDKFSKKRRKMSLGHSDKLSKKREKHPIVIFTKFQNGGKRPIVILTKFQKKEENVP